MPALDPATRRALRAKAHHLHPVVSIGQQGLTPAVLHEIDVALLAHELVKVRVFSDDRDQRESLLAEACAALDAAPVQHLGKVLVLFRADPDKAVPKAPARAKTVAKGTKAAKARGRPGATSARRDYMTASAAKKAVGGPRAPRTTAGGTARHDQRGRHLDDDRRRRRAEPSATAGGFPRNAGRDEAHGAGESAQGPAARRRRNMGSNTGRDHRGGPPPGVPRAALPRRRRAR